MRKKTYTCKICGEIYPNPISVVRHRKEDHDPENTLHFTPQTVEELQNEFEQLSAKINTMILYEQALATTLREQIAQHEGAAEKYSTLLATVNEFAKVA